MPKKTKTIKEMSVLERRRHSLEAKTFHAVLMVSLFLGIVSLIMGLGLYAYSLGNQLINDAFNLTASVKRVMDDSLDISAPCRRAMEIYHSLTEEEKAVQDDTYYERYSEVAQDPTLVVAGQILKDFYDNNNVGDIFIAMYDEETGTLLYMADPDEKRPYPTGTWEEVELRELNKFLSWDGMGTLYDLSYTTKYGWLCTTGVPIYSHDGNINAFVLADVSLTELFNGMKGFVTNYVIATVITVLLLGFLISRHIKKTMVEPINSIAGAAEEYVHSKIENGSAPTNHFKGLNIETGDEIENLYLTLSGMEDDLNTFEHDLTKAIKDQERIGTELNLAMRIQRDMLPTVFPPFPERPDFDIYASMIPAKEVGGDFYDYFLIDDDHLCIVMADVSGKGIPAALFMMASKILLKTTAMAIPNPKEILERVNNQICGNNSQEMFVTVWLGIVELSTGKLTAANAGHEYPIIKNSDGKYELLKDKHGFVLGGIENMVHSPYEIQLMPGSEVFVYTDGVTEATSEGEELYGTDRLLDALNTGAASTPKEVLDKIKRSVNDFAGNAPQFDDVTMLCFSYKGPNAWLEKEREKTEVTGEDKYMKELTLEATINNIPTVTDFVNGELEALGCPLKVQMQIDVAIDELFGNIAQYAYDPQTGPATVRVEVEEEPMAVIITFIDHGKPYDPLASDDPDISLGVDERAIGGLGVFLVKKTMDDVTYEYKNGQNILRIRKRM
ncbi:MAG: SpoIIE family protein phosphatase [Firmicutes bacterium]|nr:SpoIIE family protein phosphatase [Bacillota bacterium]